ncbi:hypothetical protein BpHYR1_044293 [Brachionus plicatilis]|uniref:Uncharacterized protein n=1 Tax=Brachionus plicatilis TaxID=10195 RepID=A0A3M7PDI0_BRAPC|nr:hypothetical protein BpHYR1_044293 [Brachionus plicatilis]
MFYLSTKTIVKCNKIIHFYNQNLADGHLTDPSGLAYEFFLLSRKNNSKQNYILFHKKILNFIMIEIEKKNTSVHYSAN